jgi:hypothetical protein
MERIMANYAAPPAPIGRVPVKGLILRRALSGAVDRLDRRTRAA